MDWFLLATALIAILVFIIANIYFLAHYAHPNDTRFGSSIPMRIFVVITIHGILNINLDLWIHY